MQRANHEQAIKYLLQEGAQPIKDSQELFTKCDMLVHGGSECELLSILPSYLDQPRIMTFPIPINGYGKRSDGTLVIDNDKLPRVTIRHLEATIERSGSELYSVGNGVIITPSMLEAGLVYGITPGTTLAKELGWEQ